MALLDRREQKGELGTCIEIRYPAAQRWFVLSLAILAMFVYAMVLLGYLPLRGAASFITSTMMLFSVMMLSFLSMNLMNWRIQVFGDRLRARRWNMDEKELMFSDLTAIWDPAKLEEIRAAQMRRGMEGKKKRLYCALVFGQDFIFMPMDYSNSIPAIERILQYCKGRQEQLAQVLCSIVERFSKKENGE